MAHIHAHPYTLVNQMTPFSQQANVLFPLVTYVLARRKSTMLACGERRQVPRGRRKRLSNT